MAGRLVAVAVPTAARTASLKSMVDFLVGLIEAALDALTGYIHDLWRRSGRRLHR